MIASLLTLPLVAPGALAAARPAPTVQASVSVGTPTSTVRVDYHAAAGEFRKRYGLDTVEPEQVDFDELLESQYVRVRLGLLDLRYPLSGHRCPARSARRH